MTIHARSVSLVILLALLILPSAAFAAFEGDLRTGDRGTGVLELQQFLIARGLLASDSATGYFGPLTKAAVIAFQQSQGITPAVGFFGPLTRAAAASLLGNTINPVAPTFIQYPATDPSVVQQIAALQKQVEKLKAQLAKLKEENADEEEEEGSLVKNGYECSVSNECASGYCYPGPLGKKYCIAQTANCAKPEADGIQYSETYTYNGSRYACVYASGLSLAPSVPNGVQCTASSDCVSGYCYPGPDNKKYCIAKTANCAKPNTSGVQYGESYTYGDGTTNGTNQYTCILGKGLEGVCQSGQSWQQACPTGEGACVWGCYSSAPPTQWSTTN